jgi:hypothetical protein
MAKADPLYSILNQYPYEVKTNKSTKKKQVLILKSSNRMQLQKDIEKELTKKKISFTKKKDSALSGSTEVTVISQPTNVYKDAVVILVYKPASGGMSETTLNSTITELAPALAFTNNLTVKTVEDFYDKLKKINHKNATVYVASRDIAAGQKFVDDFPKSSKFKTKMENAIGVLKFLQKENKTKPIKNVLWGYRAKPEGVDSKHKGDLFIEYADKSMLGISLKAGEEKSKEPKLNTYVKPILEKINPDAINPLREKLYDNIYKDFSNSRDKYDDRSQKKQTISKLAALEKKNVNQYNALYDKGLDMIRNTLTQSFEMDVKTTVDYLRAAIVGDGGEVPLLVLKAFGTEVKILTDEDDVGVFLPKTKKIKSYSSTTSKQDFYIELIASNSEKLKMKFAVRTNKVGDEHKLGQFYNLSVKFNGIVD